jgi:hypothetical protein
VGIEDMRTYQANRGRGPQYTRLDYLRQRAALWDARANGDAAAEAAAQQRVVDAFCRMDMNMEMER